MKKLFQQKTLVLIQSLVFAFVFISFGCNIDGIQEEKNDVIFDCNADSTQEEKDNIQVYFSRVDPCDEIIIGLIDKAGQEVNIAIYSITRKIISDSIIRAHRRGVSVRMVTDAGQADFAGSRDKDIEESGVPVKRIDHPGIGAMHHKFAVIDGRITITGSFNWSTNATNNNDENLLVITSTEIARQYNVEFERVWAY